MNVTRN